MVLLRFKARTAPAVVATPAPVRQRAAAKRQRGGGPAAAAGAVVAAKRRRRAPPAAAVPAAAPTAAPAPAVAPGPVLNTAHLLYMPVQSGKGAQISRLAKDAVAMGLRVLVVSMNSRPHSAQVQQRMPLRLVGLHRWLWGSHRLRWTSMCARTTPATLVSGPPSRRRPLRPSSISRSTPPFACTQLPHRTPCAHLLQLARSVTSRRGLQVPTEQRNTLSAEDGSCIQGHADSRHDAIHLPCVPTLQVVTLTGALAEV